MRSIREIFSEKKVCSYLVSREGELVKKYRFFKSFLDDNHTALNLIAEMEQMYHGGRAFSLATARMKADALLESVRSLVHNMGGIAGGKYSSLLSVVDGIDEALSRDFNPGYTFHSKDMAVPFERVTPEMYGFAGAKAGNLASIGNLLQVPIPHGFVVTAYAFKHFLEENGLVESIERKLSQLSPDSHEEIEARSKELKEMVLGAKIPPAIAEELIRAYKELEGKTYKGVRIAMRSSAVGEDTEASFAGQYTSVLNVTERNVLDAYKEVLAGKYNTRAVFYRLQNGLEDRETPMCVAGVAMVDAKSSGVVYTVDPSGKDSSVLKINSIWGLGEQLVSGEASPDVFQVDKRNHVILRKDISRKEKQLIALPHGGTRLEDVPDEEKEEASLEDASVTKLSHYAAMLEEFFKGPQDIEWAVDRQGSLFILQSRPLGISGIGLATEQEPQIDESRPVLLSGGKTASPGVAAGPVFVADHDHPSHIPADVILVAPTASPDYARFMTRIRGIITERGSVASHLASVAREFGVPAVVDAPNAASLLSTGEIVTLNADTATVYKGTVHELIENAKEVKRTLSESPLHRKMRNILDKISPLNLTDPNDPSFSPEGCKTVHDIIRFLHEKIMKEMFLVPESAEGGTRSQKLTANIPLFLHFTDLGGGLKEGLTTCDTITPDDIESIPMKAVWKGLSHPGINWSSAIDFNVSNMARLMASGAMTEFSDVVGTDSYAVVSRDYLNLSAKFGYHFANLDILCTDNNTQNYINFQFSGGVGTYYGRSLRILFLADVLDRLGFRTDIKGDYLGAYLSGYDCEFMQDKLDQMGRLLACSRLLDMALRRPEDVDRLTEMFFKGDYDFLAGKSEDQIRNFYLYQGYWKRLVKDGHVICFQDGSKAVPSVSSGFACMMGTLTGGRYQSFLDNVKAYHYFPIAIAKDSDFSEGEASVYVRCVSGCIDMAGGLAFGIRNAGNYFVLRIDALKNNVTLYEFINNKAVERAIFRHRIDPDHWYHVKVKIRKNRIEGYLEDSLTVQHRPEKVIEGFTGLWTKADSSVYFDDLTLKTSRGERKIPF